MRKHRKAAPGAALTDPVAAARIGGSNLISDA
jgi:hypothetical protein